MKTNSKQEAISLLPWYSLGKLTDSENKIVEAALKEDPSLKEQLLTEQSMISIVNEDKSLLDASLFEDTQSRLDNVLAKIDIMEGTQAATATKPAAAVEAVKPAIEKAKTIKKTEKKESLISQLKAKLDEMLGSSSHSFTYAVFAALTVVQLGLLVFFIVPSVNMDKESEFYVASAESQMVNEPIETMPPEQAGMVLIISMAGNISLDGITSLSSDVQIDFLPNDEGYYKVRVNKKLSQTELQELKNELSKKHGTIQFIGEEF